MELTELVSTISLPRQKVVELAWSPDGSMIAASYKDKTVRVWRHRPPNWEMCGEFAGHQAWVHGVAWSPNGNLVASASEDGGVQVWTAAGAKPVCEIRAFQEARCYSVSWSSDGDRLALSGGVGDGSEVWNWKGPRILHSVIGSAYAFHKQLPVGVAVSNELMLQLGDSVSFLPLPDRGLSVGWVNGDPANPAVAIGLKSGEIIVLNPLAPPQERKQRNLQGHRQGVTSLSFSASGVLLASGAPNEAIRIWRTDRWEPIGEVPGRTPRYFPYGLQFHPTKNLLAHVAEEGAAIHITRVLVERMDRAQPNSPAVHYSNAKVVLVGESGVGKTSLGVVLCGQDFRPTESSHRRNVWQFGDELHRLDNGIEERRETLLWDLAGQQTFRVVHQLSLGETAVALVLFDSRSETEPLAGVYHWARALRHAQSLASGVPVKKFLVASRVDRGGAALSRDAANQVVRDLGFDGYFEVSAKDGTGVPDLITAIRAAIEWDFLPKVSSDLLFEEIRHFLLAQKERGLLLVTENHLFATYSAAHPMAAADAESRDRFRTSIGLLDARGLIRRLSFGGFILLQPELLDAYVAAIIIAARSEPHGLGSIVEARVTNADFPIPVEERPRDSNQEQLLLFATIEELIKHELALREGNELVFPSQFQRKWEEAPDPRGKASVLAFQGPVMNIYSTLAVRLSRSGIFQPLEFWKNTVLYTVRSGGRCGIYLQESDEGRGELTVFFEGVSGESRANFEDYVETHLRRKSLAGTVTVRRIVVCPDCQTLVTDAQIAGRRARNFDFIQCNVCGETVSFATPEMAASVVPQIDRAAEEARAKQEIVSRLNAKIASDDFDVFLCHNSSDKTEVIRIGEMLKKRGYLPWLDLWNLRPGIPWQDVLEENIEKIKSAAVFVGPSGEGPWADMERRALIAEYVNRKCPVIPVLLPTVHAVPKLPAFLKAMMWVDFRVADPDPLDQLIFGITGKRPDAGAAV